MTKPFTIGILQWRRGAVVGLSAALIALIAIADWRIEFNATLGFLYMFPLLLLGSVFNGWGIVAVALFCTFLSDRLDPFPMDAEFARDQLIFLILATTGLLSRGLTNGYRREMRGLAQLEKEVAARRAAEEQLEFLIDSSPAAVLTMKADGEILLANPAAHQMLGLPPQTLPGRQIARYIPELGSIPSIEPLEATGPSPRMFRTEMQTRGQRENGEVFLADVFFSTYKTAAGPRLAALLVDTSERLREREETSLQQLLEGSRILVAAVSHEVRNVCGAIGIVHENLTRSGKLAGNQDFEALGSLVETLSKIASLELKSTTERSSSGAAKSSRADLRDILADLRIVLEPVCEENGIHLVWMSPPNLFAKPLLVQADRHSLLQVLLNLSQNSQRALERVDHKTLEIAVSLAHSATIGERVHIRVIDSGPGIPVGTQLFQPLQKGADATGLGLYLSRAFMRSFRGDLRQETTETGCTFLLELISVSDSFDSALPLKENATHAPAAS